MNHFLDSRLRNAKTAIARSPAAVCRLCSESFQISPQEEARMNTYPLLAYVCPRCASLMEEAEEAICSKIYSEPNRNSPNPDSLMPDPRNNHQTEEKNHEHYDEEPEPDEASDDEYEELCREFEADHEGGGSKENGCGAFYAEAERPVRIRIELLMNMNMNISIG